jgi:hypothetical protein
MKGHGWEEPAFFITNDHGNTATDLVTRYSKSRLAGRIENSISVRIVLLLI